MARVLLPRAWKRPKVSPKNLCIAHGIPTASFVCFDDAGGALAYINKAALPLVLKADGLAQGKGVLIVQEREQARRAVISLFDGSHCGPCARVVIEQFLRGREASVFVLCDGKRSVLLASAQDYKRVGEGDTGPNTGGMGALAPAPAMTAEMERRVMETIVMPTLGALHTAGTSFVGVLYAGLMITDDGPYLVEYNVRFGDPECQVVIPLLVGDPARLLLAISSGGLEEETAAAAASACGGRGPGGARIPRGVRARHRDKWSRKRRSSAGCARLPYRHAQGCTGYAPFWRRQKPNYRWHRRYTPTSPCPRLCSG